MTDIGLNDERTARRTARMFAFGAALMLVPLWALNVVVDPLDRHAWQFAPSIIQRTRATKVRLLTDQPRPIAGLILGSSRTFKAEPSVLEAHAGGPVFNAAVNSARAEDYLAFTRLTVERQGPPLRLLVIGLDLEAFTPAVGPDERLLRTPQLIGRLPERRRPGPLRTVRLLMEDLSWETTRASAVSLLTSEAERAAEGARLSFGADGFATLGREEDAIRAGTLDLDDEVEKSVTEYRGRFAGFDRLDSTRVRELRRTLTLAQSVGAEVAIFITPLHPTVVADLEATTPFRARHADVLALIEGLRARALIDRFFDATDIESYDGNPTMFYDGAHVREPNMRRILAHLLAH